MKTKILTLALSCASLFAIGTTGSSTISLTSSPVQVPCSSPRWVQQVKISVVPGQSGKVYLGSSSLNTSTLAGAVAILFPNAGAHSETYTLDVSPLTLDLCQLYIAGTSGDSALLSYYGGTNTNPTTYYTLALSGVITGGSSAVRLSSNAADRVQRIRAQVVPGQTGKVFIAHDSFIGNETNGTYTGVAKVLWPNSGTLSVHGGHSETFELSANDIQPNKIVAHPAVSGEQVIVSAWKNGVSANNYTFEAGALVTSTTPTQFSTTLGKVGRIRFSVVPGYCGKVYIGNSTMNTSTLAGVYRILYPTSCSGGWSEEADLGPIFTDNRYDAAILYVAGQNSGDIVTWQADKYVNNGTTIGTSEITSTVINLSSTAQSTGADCTSYVSLRPVPGGSGKTYIGKSTMNTSTLADVAAILFPNSGTMSEDYTIRDYGAAHIVGTDAYAIGSSGDLLLSLAIVTQSTPCASGFARYGLRTSGPVTGSSSAAVPLQNPGTGIYVIDLRVQAIPGQSGKLRFGSANMTSWSQPDSSFTDMFKSLFPNGGSNSISEAHSETYRVTCLQAAGATGGLSINKNCLDPNGFSFWPEVNGELILASSWGRL